MYGILILATAVSALTYEMPDTVVVLERGDGQYQVGLEEEDVAVGPYRLVAAGSMLYLLDQLNHRVLCFDTSGEFVKEIETPFRSFDMAVDASGRLYLLENRTQPAQVVVLESAKEIERFGVKYEVKQPITGLIVYPGDSLVFLSDNDLHRRTRAANLDGLLNCEPSRKVYRLKQMELPTTEVSLAESVHGFTPVGVIIDYGQTTTTFLGYDRVHIWMGLETYIQDKSGSFVMRDIEIYEGDELLDIIPVDNNYYSYDVGWRNVSVDAAGNVYMFVSNHEGKAHIERWAVSQ